jgi:lipopolysaccharide heptosyltransferase III
MGDKTYLVLSLRHLGDAVIISGLINAITGYSDGISVDVLGRPELKDITTSLCEIREYIEIDLPFYGHHKKGSLEAISALNKLWLLRKRKYDVCLNNQCDLRENVIGRLLGAKQNISPVWNPEHLFRRHIRDIGARLFIDRGVKIPASYKSFYESMDYFSRQLGFENLSWKQEAGSRIPSSGQPNVALHPGASQPSKRWPTQNWKVLMQYLHTKNYKMVLLGSPAERELLFNSFQKEIAEFCVNVVTENLPGFLDALGRADVLVGMDSFSAHAACALGIPVVMLHGPFDPKVMTPPGGVALSTGYLCKFFPCYNRVKCLGSEKEFVCVRGIEVDLVMQNIEGIFKATKK